MEAPPCPVSSYTRMNSLLSGTRKPTGFFPRIFPFKLYTPVKCVVQLCHLCHLLAALRQEFPQHALLNAKEQSFRAALFGLSLCLLQLRFLHRVCIRVRQLQLILLWLVLHPIVEHRKPGCRDIYQLPPPHPLYFEENFTSLSISQYPLLGDPCRIRNPCSFNFLIFISTFRLDIPISSAILDADSCASLDKSVRIFRCVSFNAGISVSGGITDASPMSF